MIKQVILNMELCKCSMMVLMLGFSQLLFSQHVQTISGKVVDETSQVELIGASIIVTDVTPLIGTITNEKGEFALNNVPIGRRSIQVSFLGYETAKISSVMLTSGKVLVINVELKESVTSLNEIVVSSENKHQAQNSMATISARSFSVEETRRYAGGLDDPGRLASVFAGVSDGNIESNGIVVRGNSPSGVIYRIEGVEIGNPNHFAGEDFLGGGFVSVLSNQVLANSDFLTGAFPAEYGNALSAVFDMKLRTGNTKKREYSVQVGALGIDLASEGPFIKSKDASYVVNYRYSTFGLMKNFLPSGSGIPAYQDLSFKLNFPHRNGSISIWGTGGLDDYEYKKTIDDSYKCGISGINIRNRINPTTYINTTLAVNAYTKSNRLYNGENEGYFLKNRMETIEGKFTLSSYINNKFSNRHQNRTGFNLSRLFYSYDNLFTKSQLEPLGKISDAEGKSYLFQLYSQSKINLSDRFIVTPGIHFQYFRLTDNYSIEPRIAVSYAINTNQTVSLAFGKHSQAQLLNVYFVQKTVNNSIQKPNLDLDLTIANHIIASYEYKLNDNTRIKIEPYLQLLTNVPVIADSSFSILNLDVANNFREALVNKGTGRNIGMDFTLERFLKNNFYYLITASVFNSRYKGGDGVERNTRYNKNFLINMLAGKEWGLGPKHSNIIGVNGRVYIKGGDRYGLFNPEASAQAQELILSNNGLYNNRYPVSGRFDISVTYTSNKPKHSNIIALQILNVSCSPIDYYHTYNKENNSVDRKAERFVMPSLSWKIEF